MAVNGAPPHHTAGDGSGGGAVRREPPTMAGWNLGLRFVLEIAALVGIAAGAWSLGGGALRWFTAPAASLAAATIWGVFNVVGDPSRSGRAPVEVPGGTRLALEFAVLGLGMLGLAVTAPWLAALGSCGIVVHYGFGWPRIAWLVGS